MEQRIVDLEAQVQKLSALLKSALGKTVEETVASDAVTEKTDEVQKMEVTPPDLPEAWAIDDRTVRGLERARQACHKEYRSMGKHVVE